MKKAYSTPATLSSPAFQLSGMLCQSVVIPNPDLIPTGEGSGPSGGL